MTSSHTWKTPCSGPASTHRDQPSKSRLRTLRTSLMLSKMSSPDYKLTKTPHNKMSKKLTMPASGSMMLWPLCSIMMPLLVPRYNMWLWTINGGLTRDSRNQSHPIRNGSPTNWAKKQVLMLRTAPLICSLVLEVKMIPYSTVQSIITKIKTSSLWQSTILVLLTILMT